MRTIWTIFRKELIDSLRDRRTMITMVIIPLLLFPALIVISSRVMMSQARKAQERTLVIGLITTGNASAFTEEILKRQDYHVIQDLTIEKGMRWVQQDTLDALLVFDPEFDSQIARMASGKVILYYKAMEEKDIESDRLKSMLYGFRDRLRSERFRRMGIDEAVIETIHIDEFNLASLKERLAGIAGGFVPYLFIIFCFMGAMYPAIDLAAGEKERGTLETLFTSPVGRLDIMIGKFGVVVLTGIGSAVVSLIGLYIGIGQMGDIPPELLRTVLSILKMDTILLLISLLFPLTVFFAAILLSLSIFARSFKEAQSIISPMMIIVIVPAFIGLMPGMKLTYATALIPILNVSLATRSIIAGAITLPLMLIVYISLFVYAGASIAICARIFSNERNIFR